MSFIVILNALATLVPMGLALLIPFVVELVTKSTASIHVKTVLNGALACLTAAIATVAFTGGAAELPDYLMNVFLAWIVTGRMYLTELPSLVRGAKESSNTL